MSHTDDVVRVVEGKIIWRMTTTTSFFLELLNYLQVDWPDGSFFLSWQTRLYSLHSISINSSPPPTYMHLFISEKLILYKREKEL